ncbi:MAG: succinylglutamate desuccinylase/aspartoacylase family protein, partial [Candidatus Competibacterales bacterium]|nr:succinylglutamate desuccinylase/aspartoacylase family protein [Candidatus Competibacterales bacterium]
TKLAYELRPEEVSGRVIILPALNYPALLSGTRLSPIDGFNMNRVFPGRRAGGVTEMIADYVYRYLVTAADVVGDLQSGGSSMIFSPCAVIHRLDDPDQQRASLDAGLAFGAPILLLLQELDREGMLDTVVEDLGKVFVSTELGGGAFITPGTLAIAERGVRNILRHFGVLADEPEIETPSRLMETPDQGAYEMALQAGLYEPVLEVGAAVRPGDVVGRIHDPDRLGRAPKNIHAALDGVLITRAGRGWVRRGDTIAVLATDVAAP